MQSHSVTASGVIPMDRLSWPRQKRSAGPCADRSDSTRRAGLPLFRRDQARDSVSSSSHASLRHVPPTSTFAQAALDWMEGAIWVYHHIGAIQQAHLLKTFRYAAKRYRATHFLVDSLLKCGLAEDDYTGQKRFAEAL